MDFFKKNILVVLLLMSICVVLVSEVNSANTPIQRKMSPDNVNMTAGEFFEAYTNYDKNSNDRDKAMMYLLGVLDATEGIIWCSYKSIKTISIRECIYEYFRNLPKNRLNERASVIVVEALLHNRNICKDKK